MSVIARLMALDQADKGVELDKLADKHGATNRDLNFSASAEEQKATLRKAFANVNDKAAYFAELLRWIVKNNELDPSEPFVQAELINLKTEGDRATGSLKMKVGNHERSGPIEFQKDGEVWVIDFPMVVEVKSGPPAQESKQPISP